MTTTQDPFSEEERLSLLVAMLDEAQQRLATERQALTTDLNETVLRLREENGALRQQLATIQTLLARAGAEGWQQATRALTDLAHESQAQLTRTSAALEQTVTDATQRLGGRLTGWAIVIGLVVGLAVGSFTAWWLSPASDTQAREQALVGLAGTLDEYLTEELYPVLNAQRRGEIDALYGRYPFQPPSQRQRGG
jgi:fermentation-respiration switch protein FrsA (DUF1100 family)